MLQNVFQSSLLDWQGKRFINKFIQKLVTDTPFSSQTTRYDDTMTDKRFVNASSFGVERHFSR